MNKKNGFTMVEILGVVILIAAISLLVFPAMLEQFRKAKDDINESTLNLIYSGANTLINDDLQSYPKKNGSTYCISLKTLVEEGYVSDSIKDVINDRDYDLNVATVKASYINDKFNYDFIEDGSCVSEIASVRTFDAVMSESDQVAALDPDSNPRYVGSNPNNYVWFNEELWRIIGLFDGQVKIIREEYYSRSILWDAADENGEYLNNWATASLQLALNNTTDGYIKTIQTNDPTSYGYIDLEHVWNIGGTQSYDNLTRSDFYSAERSETISSVMTSHLWTGAIGLMYPSDYGYASSGSTETCNNTVMYNWRTSKDETAYTECAENSWLYDSSKNQWTITTYSGSSNLAFRVGNTGFVYCNSVYLNYAARPVLYLKSDTKIVGGQGTFDQPFELQ